MTKMPPILGSIQSIYGESIMKVVKALFATAVAAALLGGSAVANAAPGFSAGNYSQTQIGNNLDYYTIWDTLSITGIAGALSAGTQSIGTYSFGAGPSTYGSPTINGSTGSFLMTIGGVAKAIDFPWTLAIGAVDTLTFSNAAPAIFTVGSNYWVVKGLGFGPIINDGSGDGIMSGNVMASFATAPVPEPETFAMLLAGLGLIGTIARRRKVSATANA
jgi:hypothetical protein